MSKGKETVLLDKDLRMNVANTKQITGDITLENINDHLSLYVSWQ
jgi:hypothetical protein